MFCLLSLRYRRFCINGVIEWLSGIGGVLELENMME